MEDIGDVVIEWIENNFRPTLNGWKAKLGGRQISSSDLRGQIPDDLDSPKVALLEELRNLYLQNASNDAEGVSNLPRHTYEWLKWYMEQPGCPYGINLVKWMYYDVSSNASYTDNEVGAMLVTHLEEYNTNIPMITNPQTGASKKAFDKIPLSNLSNALDRYKTEIRMKDLRDVQERIAFDSSLDSGLADEVLGDIFDIYHFAGDRAVVIQCMKHWLWIAKRRVFELRPKDHIMLSFYGKQGCGKSRLLQKFGYPLGKKGHSITDLSQTSANFDVQSLVRQSYIIDIEELADPDSKGTGGILDQGRVAKVKSLITMDEVVGRVFHGAGAQRVPVMATYGCTTNNHVYDVIRDRDYRRFLEIVVERTEVTLDEEPMLDELDEKIVWLYRTIDERKEAGYLKIDKAIYKRMRKIQMGYIKPTSIAAWASGYGVGYDIPAADTKIVEIRSLFSSFGSWYKNHNPGKNMLYGMDGFVRDLEQIWGARYKVSGKHLDRHCYYIGPVVPEEEEV